MSLSLTGIHHVTAVTGQAAANVEFYTRVLGLRLVKKTVNQDDVAAYHLFYGDEVGSPGTELTFFDWAYAGPNRPGAGEVASTGLRVSGREALDWWQRRLEAEGVAHEGISMQGKRATLGFTDSEGQRLRLVEDADGPVNTPWSHSPVPPEMAIRGLGPVVLSVRSLEPTARVLTEVLSYRRSDEYLLQSAQLSTPVHVTVFETGPGGAASEVHVAEVPGAAGARNGIGGVHHVAFRAPDDMQHAQWQQLLSQAGMGVTPVIDRFYFKSIYFREPGGVLFEIATDGPGFATDEDAAHLGEKLALPPFLEPHRLRIEAGLKPLPTQDVLGGHNAGTS
ncbi:MAG: glyoxalase family protein [Abditibacteriota bacterium]|nr:glyoxalase family protein [Abditibacteriota bacterium]